MSLQDILIHNNSLVWPTIVISCAVFFITYREMKLTSPRLNLVVAVGGIVWYTSATVLTIPNTDLAWFTAQCEVRCTNKVLIIVHDSSYAK